MSGVPSESPSLLPGESAGALYSSSQKIVTRVKPVLFGILGFFMVLQWIGIFVDYEGGTVAGAFIMFVILGVPLICLALVVPGWSTWGKARFREQQAGYSTILDGKADRNLWLLDPGTGDTLGRPGRTLAPAPPTTQAEAKKLFRTVLVATFALLLTTLVLAILF